MYSTSSQGKSLSENLPPRTLARVSREVREMMRNPAEGTKLVTDPDTGLPPSLHEIMVSVERFHDFINKHRPDGDRGQATKLS